MNTTYLSAAETAKLIRAQLKKHYPTTKFYVNSDTYSGGASIDIDWIDGPAKKEVETIISPFKGANFDGMVDLKSYNKAWLLPDGSAVFAEYAQDYQTTIHTDRPTPDAKPVHFGADFIFCNRHFTPDFAKPVIKAVCDEFGVPEPTYYERDTAHITRTTKSPVTLLDWDCCSPQWRDLDFHINAEVHKRLNDNGTKPTPKTEPKTEPKKDGKTFSQVTSGKWDAYKVTFKS